MKKIIVVSFFLVSISGYAQQGWVYINPTPTAASRYDLTMFSETSGICRGSNSIFKTYNGGFSWEEYNLPNSEIYITCFYMVDSSLGYIVTRAGNFLKTINGGRNWNFVSQILYYSYKLKFFSADTGFLINYTDSGISKILKTTNSGLNWTQSFSDDSINIRDLCFVSSSTGFAVGYKRQNNDEYYSKILKTTNSGISWDSITCKLGRDLEKIFFLNESTGFLYGMIYPFVNKIYRTTNGGLSWGDTLNYALSDMRFLNSTTGYFINDYRTLGRTTNAGANWSFSSIANQTINTSCYPTQMCFVNLTTAICTGYLGLSLRTTDNGQTWINYNSSFTSEILGDVEFKDANIGLITGYGNFYFKTTNAGQNWTKFYLGGSNTEFGAMAYAGSNTWYVGANAYPRRLVYKTTNAGTTWDSCNAEIDYMTDLKFINENTGFGVSKYNTFVKTTNGGINRFVNNSLGSNNFSVNFIDENTGYVGGEGLLKKTTNGGITFVAESINGMDVKFINKDTLFVSGYSRVNQNYIGIIWKSTNAGVSWVPHYLPPNSYFLGKLQFPDAYTGYFYEDGGIQLKTTNAGENWFQIRGVELAKSVNFINSETGYAVGYAGVIAKTTNGGASTFINTNESVAQSFSLYQNYPNPFNPSTKIKFDLPENGNRKLPVKVIIFDILGRMLETLLDENLPAGVHEINWNASRYAAGVYFYMLLTDGIKETKKMILIK